MGFQLYTFRGFSLNISLILSFLWVFHLKLVLEYLIIDFRKKIIVQNDKILLIRNNKITQLNKNNISEVILYKSRNHYKAPFTDFSFLKIKLSNGRIMFLTSLSSDTKKAANVLFPNKKHEIKYKFYPSLIIQKMISIIHNKKI